MAALLGPSSVIDLRASQRPGPSYVLDRDAEGAFPLEQYSLQGSEGPFCGTSLFNAETADVLLLLLPPSRHIGLPVPVPSFHLPFAARRALQLWLVSFRRRS